MLSKKWYAIVNPASANGRTRKLWPHLLNEICQEGWQIDFAYTNKPGNGSKLTAEALKEGFRRFIVVGGDGTLNEVLNGLFAEGFVQDNVEIAILSQGTGGDFLRSFNISKGVKDFIEVLRRSQVQTVDVGMVSYVNNNGQTESRYFLNVADAGLGGETVERVNRQSKFLGGKISFLWGSVQSILAYRNKLMRCIVDGKVVASGKVNSVMVCNGRFIGGGMMIAPEAILNDGLFDVVILGNFSKLELIRHLPKIYQGKHIKIPGVSVVRGSKVKVETRDRILLDIDGEQPGCAPASFSILPKAVRIWT